MSLQTVGAIVCLFLAQVAADTGVHFVMERHPDSYFCGHLQCVADLTKSDQDVSSCVEMTIYDITRVNSELKLASVSTFDPDLYVDMTKSSAMSCTGTISRLQANLTLKLRHDIDCLYGVYKCQLDLVTESGHSEVLTEIVIPENNHSYSRVAEVISHIDELTGLFNIHTTLVSNQSTVINKLESHLVDITSQLMNQTKEINRQKGRCDNQATKLTDQTAEINKLGSRLENQTTKLMNQTEEISKQGSRLDNQTTKLTDQTDEINKLGSRLDDLTVQLINQTAQLDNMSQRQKQQHDAVEKRLMALDLKLDTIQKLLHQMSYKPLGSVCYRDMPHINTREKFLLYGNVPALCDTETDGGGWVVIQRRVRGDVDFYRGWDDYKRGFGTPDTDFWIGNDIIHNLTSQGYNELRIDFVYNGTDYFAQYTAFSVADESSNYRITISGHSGNIYDGMAYHNGSSFSTPDRDNGRWSSSCSVRYHGSWWYNGCYEANLNGAWAETDNTGIVWFYSSTLHRRPLTFTEMKIRYI